VKYGKDFTGQGEQVSEKQKLGKQKAESRKLKSESTESGKELIISTFCFLDFCFSSD